MFLLYPLGFYFKVSDAYLSHNLYSSNTAEASICRGPTGSGLCLTAPFFTLDTLNVPLPPEPRLFVQWFELICQPEEKLRIAGINTRLFDRSTTYRPCPMRAGG